MHRPLVGTGLFVSAVSFKKRNLMPIHAQLTTMTTNNLTKKAYTRPFYKTLRSKSIRG